MNRTEKDTNVEDVTENMSEKEIKRYWNMIWIFAVLDIFCFITTLILTY